MNFRLCTPCNGRPHASRAQERKKISRQRRLEREKEKQELISQGLLEPPPPKVKISNLMRVLGDRAVADPSAIEAEVRAQMAEREQVRPRGGVPFPFSWYAPCCLPRTAVHGLPW